MSVIRVGFIFEVFDSRWTGGVNYYINLIRTIQTMRDSRIEIVIFTGQNIDLHGLEKYAQVVRSSIFDKGSFPRNIRKITQRLLGRDLFFYQLLKQYKIDCVSHTESLWKTCPIPALPWIPDFQHKRLPNFFDAKEIARRDSLHTNLLESERSILLSSYSAAEDLKRFYPDADIDVNILQFVSSPPVDWQPQEKSQLQQLYQLPEHWFHVPNQLWVHKNHLIVIEALSRLKTRGIEPTVVCTGNTVDFRNPDHFQLLTKKVEALGLENSFRILGSIPYDDMLGLMYHAVAVINPSLFEGWSTTVEESKSMGKNILLSEIDVHIEQSPKRSHYFGPDDSAKLADLIEQVLDNYDPEEEQKQMLLAKNEEIERRQGFARAYQEIIVKLTTKV